MLHAIMKTTTSLITKENQRMPGVWVSNGYGNIICTPHFTKGNHGLYRYLQSQFQQAYWVSVTIWRTKPKELKITWNDDIISTQNPNERHYS